MSARLVFALLATSIGKWNTDGGERSSAVAETCIICAYLRGTDLSLRAIDLSLHAIDLSLRGIDLSLRAIDLSLRWY
jgi:hypothetical protein